MEKTEQFTWKKPNAAGEFEFCFLHGQYRDTPEEVLAQKIQFEQTFPYLPTDTWVMVKITTELYQHRVMPIRGKITLPRVWPTLLYNSANVPFEEGTPKDENDPRFLKNDIRSIGTKLVRDEDNNIQLNVWLYSTYKDKSQADEGDKYRVRVDIEDKRTDRIIFSKELSSLADLLYPLIADDGNTYEVGIYWVDEYDPEKHF